jgi:L-lactate dehydrogenase complex protein LldF
VKGGFPAAAREALRDEQLRRNLAVATKTIQQRRAEVVGERPDWEELREAGRALNERVLRHLGDYLLEFESAVERARGSVHWARDAAEANRIVVGLVDATGAREVIKVKSLTTDEIRLNEALDAAGIATVETDLAELICQLAGEEPSHILVPAIHKNRFEIRDLFRREFGLPDLTAEPAELTAAARAYLRRKFLEARVAISGANFAVAETGTVCVVESEGNGRFCTTLPRTLITVLGIEKLVPAPEDLAVFLQLLPRSSTGERMNPYTTLWTGVTHGDGPDKFHVVLLDNGRTDVLADEVGRQTLACIRCSACLNVCPVYSRTGGHAYESVYPGPIGAILTPQLRGVHAARTLPFASTLCAACADVCPVKIDIPQVLVHLRGRVVRETVGRADPERLAMRALAHAFSDERRFERAQHGRSVRPHDRAAEQHVGTRGEVPQRRRRERARADASPVGLTGRSELGFLHRHVLGVRPGQRTAGPRVRQPRPRLGSGADAAPLRGRPRRDARGAGVLDLAREAAHRRSGLGRGTVPDGERPARG